jgi:hypothetical protein
VVKQADVSGMFAILGELAGGALLPFAVSFAVAVDIAPLELIGYYIGFI